MSLPNNDSESLIELNREDEIKFIEDFKALCIYERRLDLKTEKDHNTEQINKIKEKKKELAIKMYLRANELERRELFGRG